MNDVLLICAPRGYFGDDVKAACATCNAPIVHRPHVPADAVKVCLQCGAIAMNAAMKAGQEITVKVTEETRREKALYDAETRGTQ